MDRGYASLNKLTGELREKLGRAEADFSEFKEKDQVLELQACIS